MKRFKNILYVIDGKTIDEQSSADKVASLARINSARVTTITSEENTLTEHISKALIGRINELKNAVQKQRQEQMERFLSDVRWNGISVCAHGEHQNGFIEIIQKVLRDGHDLVIKEAALNQGLDQLSMRLVRKCPCPVWIIKSGDHDFRRILAALDVGSDYPETVRLNKKIVELAYSLAQREQGEAHYLHTWRMEYEMMLGGPRFNVSADEISAMKKEMREQRLSRLKKLLRHNHIPETADNIHIVEGTVFEVTRKLINELQIDVVVMGSVGRSGIPGLLIGNKAERLLNIINCTVMTVKPDGFESPVTL